MEARVFVLNLKPSLGVKHLHIYLLLTSELNRGKQNIVIKQINKILIFLSHVVSVNVIIWREVSRDGWKIIVFISPVSKKS